MAENTTILATPPLPLLVPAATFDACSWCPSTALEWRRPHDALALNALDDATDLLWEHRRAPGDVFWLAADSVNAVYWALHDWSHFHNHGSFTDRPATELQCDAAALVWLWRNRDAVGLPDAHWEALRAASLDNHLALRAKEPDTRAPPPEVLADPRRLRALADALG